MPARLPQHLPPWLAALAALVAALTLSTPVAPARARAQAGAQTSATGVGDPGPDSPWGKGVALAAQQRARDLYQRGNQLFATGTYAGAAELYEGALAAWAHPAIRYNLGVCLIELDQPVRAFRNLQRGMAFGVEPLGDARFMKGLEYLRRLRPRVAELTVVCARERGSLALDGRHLVRCAGRTVEILAPGRHEIVAREPGFPTTRQSVELAGGERETVVLDVGAGTLGIELLGGVPVWRIRESEQRATEQAAAAEAAAEHARTAERVSQERLAEIERKERERQAAQHALSAKEEQRAAAREDAERASAEALRNANDVKVTNVKLEQALAEARRARELAEVESAAARAAAQRSEAAAEAARKATAAERAARAELRKLLEEKKRELEEARANITKELR